MREGQLRGVEKLSPQSLDCPALRWIAELPISSQPVQRVAGHWMLDVRAVDANLMGPSSFNSDIEQRRRAQPPKRGITRPGRASGGIDRHLETIFSVAADWGVNDAGAADIAVHQRHIALFHGSRPKLPGEMLKRRVSLGHDHHAGSVTVEAMDNART